MIKSYLYLVSIILMLVIGLPLLDKSITGRVVQDSDEQIVISFPKSADFPDDSGGVVVFEFNFPAASFLVNNKSADVLLLLDSATIPGLRLGYDINDGKIKGGLPILETPPVNIIDNKPHKIIYSFNREENRQSISLDGVVLAESGYDGKARQDWITGFSVFNSQEIYEVPMEIKVKYN